MSAPRGVRLVDAGVSTVGDHEEGSLALFVGGDPADVDAAVVFADEAHVELLLPPPVRALLRPVMLLPPKP